MKHNTPQARNWHTPANIAAPKPLAAEKVPAAAVKPLATARKFSFETDYKLPTKPAKKRAQEE